MENRENRIKQLREERHMTQVRLSIELEVSQEAVSAYEHGKHYPSVSTLMKLANLFHTSCDYILGLTDLRYSPSEADNQLRDDEHMILEKYNALDTDRRGLLCAYADGLLALINGQKS